MFRTVIQMIRSGEVDFTQLLFLLGAYMVLILVLMPVHEFSHALVADKLGDKTPRWNGRLTLNPLAHINWIGAAMILLFGIGYAQPVPVSPRNFKKARRDMALTALAGPVSNLLMAVLSVAIFRVLMIFGGDFRVVGNSLYVDNEWMYYAYIVLIQVFASVNIGLAVFNLLPIPPLDGSRIFAAILPRKWAYYMDQYERYITIGLFVLLFTGVLDTPLYWLREGLCGLIGALFGMPYLF
ncbi:MAG: site-2 protease family protein [Acutalibacteraceae bacterium]|jgi:Zn-dependent protease